MSSPDAPEDRAAAPEGAARADAGAGEKAPDLRAIVAQLDQKLGADSYEADYAAFVAALEAGGGAPGAPCADDRLVLELVQGGHGSYEGDWVALEAALKGGGAPTPGAAGLALQIAAGRLDTQCLEVLLAHCPQITPQARSAALDAALGWDTVDRADTVLQLLIDAGAEPSPQALLEAAEAAEDGDTTLLCVYAPFVAKALRAGRAAPSAAAGTAE
jgi:hypothetical protein